MSPARRPWHRRPTLHFLALGALLFAGRSVLDATSDPDPVQLTPSVREALRHRFVSQAGREPSAHEMAALVRDALDEEILFREALALGLERRDPVVHQRLVRNLRFLAEDGAPERDDASLVETKNVCGARVPTAAGTWEVTFRTTGPLAGHIRRTGGGPINRQLARTVQPQQGLMLQAKQP